MLQWMQEKLTIFLMWSFVLIVLYKMSPWWQKNIDSYSLLYFIYLPLLLLYSISIEVHIYLALYFVLMMANFSLFNRMVETEMMAAFAFFAILTAIGKSIYNLVYAHKQ